MSNKIYVSVFINDKQFSVGETEHKHRGGALSTLSLIETVIQEQLEYVINVEDKLSELDQDGRYTVLKQKAKLIRDRYMEKTASLSCVRRFFGSVSNKEEVVQAAFNRIVELAAPTMNNTINRAREYGFEGRGFAKAKTYLEDFLHDVSWFLCTYGGHFFKQHLVHKGRERSIDVKATLRNIKRILKAGGKEAEDLQATLNAELFRYSKGNHIRFCKALIRLGADVNSKHDGETPLSVAFNRKYHHLYSCLFMCGRNSSYLYLFE